MREIIMLRKKIENRIARAGVIGLGYVGLPLAVSIARAGFRVTGIDVDPNKVEAINRGISYIEDVDSEELTSLVRLGRIDATTDYAVLAELDTVDICVPTPLGKSKEPDMSYIISAVEQIARYIRANQLIILESTTYPGTTEEIVMPKLEERSGLKVGRDIFLAFSPERIDPGNEIYTLSNTPKIVGGITPKCTEIAKIFYQQFINKVVPVSSTRAAEMVKLLENTFRAVNIGLVNEMALMCDKMGLDVWEIVEAAATKPFGFMPFYPGPGLGGHCLPIDPHYLSWKAKSFEFYARFIELASEINSSMPHHVLKKITDALNSHKKCINGAKLLIIGVAYKKNVGDTRESPALDIIEMLAERGGEILYSDPYVPEIQTDGHNWKSFELTDSLLKQVDCVIIITNHSCLDYQRIVEHAQLVVDARNATADVRFGREKIVKI
jgi:UDP-N-acetyl-D-glucosamine dehydrogenase